MGDTIALVVSRWLPIVAAAQVRSRKICGGQNGTGAGFIQVLQFQEEWCLLGCYAVWLL
jgi:hypothetical protein